MIFQCLLSATQLQSIPLTILSEAAGELIRAHRRGLHMLVIGRESANFILKYYDLTDSEKATLQRVKGEFTQTGKMPQSAKIFIDLSIGEAIYKTPSMISVPLSHISASLLSVATLLIVENMNNDGFVYETILQSTHLYIGIPRICIRKEHGGGDDILGVLHSRAKEGHLAVCIVDADASAPVGLKSHKAASILAAASQYKLVHTSINPCREIENIVSREVVKLLPCRHACSWLEKADIICQLDKSEDFWLHLDLKEGCSTASLAKMDDASRQWLERRLELSGIDSSDFDEPGFGKNVIPLLKSTGAATTAFRQDVRTREWRSIFQSFIEGFAWWFCAAERIRT